MHENREIGIRKHSRAKRGEKKGLIKGRNQINIRDEIEADHFVKI